jgi:hypothetical protein
MSHAAPLVIDLEREAVEDARRLTVEQRLALGGDLFDSACEVTLNFIRAENAGISPAEARDILRRRLELGRRLEPRA